MKLSGPRSLRWKLTFRIIVAQVLLIMTLAVIQIVIEAALWSSGRLYYGADPWAAVNAIAESVHRDPAHHLEIRASQQLEVYEKQYPGFWFVVRDQEGQQLRYGTPPGDMAGAAQLMDAVAYADLVQNINKDTSPQGTIQWARSAAGDIKIITTPDIPVTFSKAISLGIVKNIVVVIFLSIVIVLVMLLIMPRIVRNTLRGIASAASEAKNVNYSETSVRISRKDIPTEILPFVDAVNNAFERLDKGVESQRRFLMDAAHELRTPISILNTRLSTLPSGPLKNKLLTDTARLTMLTGQLLDVHRMQDGQVNFENTDLVKLTESVVADIAPLAIGAGYEISFENLVTEALTSADSLAIERALTNLIQNAIRYGGHSGLICVQVDESGCINVIDEGQGIPVSERERIFESFHRLLNDGKGTGLGLDLVKKIMTLHGGSVELVFTSNKEFGAHFKLIFPNISVTEQT